MNLEVQIINTKNKIDSIKSRIYSITREIDNAGYERQKESAKTTTNVAFMGSKTTRNVGTYGYIQSASKTAQWTAKISELENEKRLLNSGLLEEEKKLKALEEQFEYESRPDAKLIILGEGVYLEGDEKVNLLNPVQDEVEAYIANYKQVIESADVAEYKKLNSEIEEFVKTSELPKATESNVRALDIIKHRHDVGFEYVVIDGKIVVDRDFVTSVVMEEQRSRARFAEQIDINDAKKQQFKPRGLGKVLNRVRKKQQDKYNIEIDDENSKYNSIASDIDSKIRELETAKDIYINPSIPIMSKLTKLIKLCESKRVRTFVYESDDMQNNISEHTILSKGLNQDVISMIMEQLRPHLDKQHVKLTREQLESVLYSGNYNEELKAEIANALNAVQSDKNGREDRRQQKSLTEEELALTNSD